MTKVGDDEPGQGETDRRSVLLGFAAISGLATAPSAKAATGRGYRRIACEEGYLSPGVLRQNAKTPLSGIPLITSEGPGAVFASASVDIGAGRIARMDADGIDMQLLLLSSPGVQVFDAPTGTALAAEANDYASAACARHPSRFAALAAVAPQDPQGAVKELVRAAKLPGIKGAIINSHTQDAYLDEPRFWPILEAIEALGMPLYIHPREPAGAMRSVMAGPVVGGPAWAYGVEVGTHVLRMVQAGVFDRFPKLKLVIGHMGESLPFWLPRIDNRYLAMGRGNGRAVIRKLPSEYVRENIWVTTSGMNYWPQLKMTIDVLGADRVMYATDYPFEDQGQAVAMAEAMPLTTVQKTAFFQDNAARLFNL